MLLLRVIHDRFDDVVDGIENAFVRQVEIVGEDGKRDVLAASSCGISGKRLDSAERASLGVNVSPWIKIREAIRQRAVDTGDRQRFPEARTPRLARGMAQ